MKSLFGMVEGLRLSDLNYNAKKHMKGSSWTGNFFLFVFLLYSVSCSSPEKVKRLHLELPVDVDVAECEPGVQGGFLVMSESTEPKTFNALVEADQTSSSIQSKFLSGLVDYHPIKEAYIPALAKSWKVSRDGLNYTFHLRKGLKWSDGEPFTADDVIFTLDCIFTHEVNEETGEVVVNDETGKPKYKYRTRSASDFTIGGEPMGYKKIDDYTIRLSTAVTYAPFIYSIGNIKVLPKHKLFDSFKDGTFLEQWSSKTAIETPEEIVGLGPYIVELFKPSQRLVLRANPHYWRADKEGVRLPYIDRLIYKFVKNANTEIVMFSSGETDIAGISATDLAWVKKAQEKRGFKIIERGPSASQLFMWFNQNRGSNEEGKPYVAPHKLKWFTNKLFRQAVAHGLNREGIVKGVYFGYAKLLHAAVSANQRKWSNDKVRRYPYDVEEAKRLLKEAGFKINESNRLIDDERNLVDFELVVFDGSQRVTSIVTTFQENMKDLGIKVKVAYIDFGSLLKRLDKSFDYDMSLIGWGSSSAAYDPNGSKALYHSSGMHHVWYPNQDKPATAWEKRMDDIMGEQESELDVEKRVDLIKELQMIMAEEVPLQYLITSVGFIGVKKKWRNVITPPAGTQFWNIDEVWDGDLVK